MLENMNADHFEETNNKVSRVWVETVNEWQNERFAIIYEKRVYQQKSGRCGCLQSGKRFHNLARDRCAQRDKASFARSNESAPHIRDMVGNLLKRLLNSFVAQSLIELIKAMME